MLVCLLASFALVQVPFKEDRASLYEWFDSLGYTQLYSGDFLEIQTWDKDHKKDSLSTSYGFKVEGRQPIQAMAMPFLTRGMADSKPYRGTSIKRVDFDSWAENQLSLLKKSNPRKLEAKLHVYGARDMFVVSRIAALRGKEDLSKQWFAVMGRQRSMLRMGDRWEEVSAAIGMRAKLAEPVVRIATYSLAQPQSSWRECADAFDFYVKHFGKQEFSEFAREASSTLRAMATADESHVAPSAHAPLDKRIDELVYQLQDQQGRQWMNPGDCDVFQDERREESPAHKLAHIGYPAVPRLLDALRDTRFSRSDRNWKYPIPNSVLRVGEVAEQVLERIAGRRFGEYQLAINKPSDVEKEARAWWEALQKKGERRALIDAVKKGDDRGREQAYVLKKRYPDDLPAAVEVGIKNSIRGWIRGELVSTLEGRADAASKRIALKSLKEGKSLSERFAAAGVVVAFNKRLAIDRMIEDWKRLEKSDADDGDSMVRDDLLRWLPSMQDSKAIEAIAADVPRKSASFRLGLVAAFVTGIELPAGIPKPKPDELQRYMKGLESLLASRLGDTERVFGTSMGISCGDKSLSFDNPRICDVAACAMAETWPTRYAYKDVPSLREREGYRIRSLNAWRVRQGKKPIAVPPKAKRASSPKVVSSVSRTGSWNLWPDLARQLDSLKGMELTEARLKGIAATIDKRWPPSVNRLELHLFRDSDGSGFACSASVGKGRVSVESLNFGQYVSVDGENVLASGGGFDAESFMEAIGKALRAGGRQVIAIDVVGRAQGG